jgi:uncharacterized protein
MKFLIWFFIVLLVIWFVRKQQADSRKAAQRPAAPESTPAGGESAQVEQMLQCSQCGIFLPVSEAVREPTGEAYCCERHRQLHARS